MLPVKTLVFALSILVSTISAIPTVSVKGAKFFANGQQFFIKGVAYQGTPNDPLIDVAQCTTDANLMQRIGTNAIRVYHVNPYADHSGCMAVFASSGIYLFLDLDTFNTSISESSPTWTATQFEAFTQVMDAFHVYDNLAAFWIGNEVINTAAGSAAAPYIKAAVADMKSYLSLKNYRDIPIGYSAADIAELRPSLQNYLACSSSSAQNIDFYGLNSYEWCGPSSYTTSGYANLQTMSQNYSLPIFFSETGCNVAPPRLFTDQAAIFGPNMTDTWSGSIVYEWAQETNDYGLVSYPNGVFAGAPTPIQPDFGNLQAQWKTLSPTGVAEAMYTPSLSPPACPVATGGWMVDGEVELPTLGMQVVSAVAASSWASNTATGVSQATTTYVADSGVAAVTAAAGVGNGTLTTATATATATASASASVSTNGNSLKAASGVSRLGKRSVGVDVLVLCVVLGMLL